MNFLDYRVFTVNNSDVRLDLDSDGSFGLALTIIVTMAKDARELGDSKLKPRKVLIVVCFVVFYIPISRAKTKNTRPINLLTYHFSLAAYRDFKSKIQANHIP